MYNHDISNFVWKNKYRKTNKSTGVLDASLTDSYQRTLDHIFNNKQIELKIKLLDAFTSQKILPGGRIIAGSGILETRTLVNTFVIDCLDGSANNTIDNLIVSAKTMRAGGGIGCNLSDIPPLGAPMRNGGRSPGVISIMELWNKMCSSLLSSAAQRGAMMMVIDCDHPEILEFIDSKKDKGSLEFMNISVFISDKFMLAQSSNADWELIFDGKVYKKVKARWLWDRILRQAYRGAEPGVIFFDSIMKNNNLGETESIIATNSCAEQPLPKHGSAALASVNFAKIINNPFTPHAALDFSELRELVHSGVTFLDNVIDNTYYPFEEQKTQAMRTRRIGLGLTGLGDALAMCNVRYAVRIIVMNVNVDDFNVKIDAVVFLLSAENADLNVVCDCLKLLGDISDSWGEQEIVFYIKEKIKEVDYMSKNIHERFYD